ncbi:MAG: phenylalanine--tRNA ligase subunit alpha, partial [Bacteroidales bacterium]|nr:phenylalanine--tRNA ligase subunit alpha [Bacteroidales bacterium]
MNQKIEELSALIRNLTAQKEQELEDIRVKLLGKKGEITRLFEDFRTVPAEQKRLFGQKLNVLKNEALAKIDEIREALASSITASSASFDLTKPGDAMNLGARHPISLTREEILGIFKKFGYSVAEGPEIEDDWHVFSALNFPPEHPARDMQDTFFINNNSDNNILLRTHTSSVQVRTMEKVQPPIRVVCPGRVFRNEAISA